LKRSKVYNRCFLFYYIKLKGVKMAQAQIQQKPAQATDAGGQQPTGAQAQPAEGKKTKWWLWLIIAIVVIGIGVGVYYFFF